MYSSYLLLASVLGSSELLGTVQNALGLSIISRGCTDLSCPAISLIARRDRATGQADGEFTGVHQRIGKTTYSNHTGFRGLEECG